MKMVPFCGLEGTPTFFGSHHQPPLLLTTARQTPGGGDKLGCDCHVALLLARCPR